MHMGFQQPYYFKQVLELIFENGKLIRTINHSKEMEKVREKELRISNLEDVDSDDYEELDRFIKESFSSSYDKKWL